MDLSSKDAMDLEETSKEETTRNGAKDEEEQEEDPCCRICFEGSEAGELISPCDCKGSSKFIHLSCLRRWQRMVLVSQPTHPAFWDDENESRHHVCNTCKGNFSIPPPTRKELYESFTGAEIAALLDVGKIIAARDVFTQMLQDEMRRNPLVSLIGSYQHWIKGVYLITSVEEDDGILKVPLDDELELRAVARKLGSNLEIKIHERTFKLLPEGPLEDVPAENLREELLGLDTPCKISLGSCGGKNCGEDSITAVNLSRPMGSSSLPHSLEEKHGKLVSQLSKQFPNVSKIEVQYYRGGPVDDDKIVSCLVLGGTKGYTVVDSLKHALVLACRRLEPSKNDDDENNNKNEDENENENENENDPKQTLHSGQVVTLKGLQNRVELNGQKGIICGFVENVSRWAVRISNGEVKTLKSKNLEIFETPQVWAFLGDARWTRSQLLGEIARGHWGLAQVLPLDLINVPDKRWDDVDPRLAFAPPTEMTDKHVKQHLDQLRREAQLAAETDDGASLS